MLNTGLLGNALHASMHRSDLLDARAQRLEAAAQAPLTKNGAAMVAQEFESLFLAQMLEHMFSGDTLGESLFGNAESDAIYQSMMVEEYAKSLSARGGIGIAKHIEETLARRALLSTQEVPHA